MKKRLSAEVFRKFEALCCQNGFFKRGSAFFRILDDSVLQVIKFEFEYAMHHYDLRFGLFSMLSPLEKQWFTSLGCIPQYSIVNIRGFRSPVTLHNTDGFIEAEVLSPAQQLCMLEETGFGWLNAVRTQQQIIQALCELDMVRTQAIRWNDVLRIEPYLATSQVELADKIIQTIFRQRVGPKAWTESPWTESDFMRYTQMGFDTHVAPGLVTDLMEIHCWIKENQQAQIREYLERNYLSNIQFAKFLY